MLGEAIARVAARHKPLCDGRVVGRKSEATSAVKTFEPRRDEGTKVIIIGAKHAFSFFVSSCASWFERSLWPIP
jgi:hypothetical protein